MHKTANGNYRHMGWNISVVRGIPTSTGWRNTYGVEGYSFDTRDEARRHIERREKEIFECAELREGEVAEFCPTCGMQQPTDMELKMEKSVEPRCWGGAPCDVCRTPQ